MTSVLRYSTAVRSFLAASLSVKGGENVCKINKVTKCLRPGFSHSCTETLSLLFYSYPCISFKFKSVLSKTRCSQDCSLLLNISQVFYCSSGVPYLAMHPGQKSKNSRYCLHWRFSAALSFLSDTASLCAASNFNVLFLLPYCIAVVLTWYLHLGLLQYSLRG